MNGKTMRLVGGLATAIVLCLAPITAAAAATPAAPASPSAPASPAATSAAAAAEVGTFATAASTVSGTRQVGKTLTATFPVWKPTPTTKAIRRCRDGKPIDGATAYRGMWKIGTQVTPGTYRMTVSDPDFGCNWKTRGSTWWNDELDGGFAKKVGATLTATIVPTD